MLIQRARLIYTAEKHQRVGTVRVEPDLFGRQRDSLVRGFECPGEVVCQDERVSQSAKPVIASCNAGEGDVLDEGLERNCHACNIALAVGGKCEGELTG